jgi:hypothetical protein
MVRFDTYRLSAYIVDLLQNSPSVSHIIHDGGDIIQIELKGGVVVSLYLIEAAISTQTIHTLYSDNTAQGVATLLILWRDLLLPQDGQPSEMTDWMNLILKLHDGMIYAYDPYGPDLFIFPIYFDGHGAERIARYGADLDLTTLHGGMIDGWRVASFNRAQAKQQAHGHAHHHNAHIVRPSTVDDDYHALGISRGASREGVKRAFRRLARVYHPDVNKHPNALQQMQRLNEAYQHVLAHLGDGG